MKVRIFVSGGVVQSVFADSKDADVEVIDFDNSQADGTESEADAKFVAAQGEMFSVA